MSERIALLGGTGDLGYGLALRLARVGTSVVIGSRSHERAVAAAERARTVLPGAAIDGAPNAEAVRLAEIVVLSVPFAAQRATLADVAEHLAPGHLVVDCTVPLAAAVGGRPTHTIGVWHGSAAQQARDAVPDEVPVVAAFHSVSAAVLADLERELDEDVLICGDKLADKARVAHLVSAVPGLRPVNAGKLETARIVEQLTPLLISINGRYKTHAGIRITGLPDGDPWSPARRAQAA